MKLRSPYTLLKIVPIVFITLLAASVIVTMIFLYRNFYQTLEQVESVEFLEQNVARESLKRSLWDKVITERMNKLSEDEKTSPGYIRDPFSSL